MTSNSPSRVDTVLSSIALICIAIVLTVSPWLFGAWEMWWFWSFTALIFAAGGCLGARLLLEARRTRPQDADLNNARPSIAASIGVISYLPFLLYALIQFALAPVFMDAERSFMLFLSPFLLALVIVFGLRSRHQSVIFPIIMINLLLIGLYGIINHLVDGSRHVLWVAAYPDYVLEDRAMGCYFCPDHFCGAMELGFCMAIAALMDKRTGRALKVAGALLLPVALTAVVLSKSRGGGLTILLVSALAVAIGFKQWPAKQKRSIQLGTLAALALGLISFVVLASGYTSRFKNHFAWDQTKGKTVSQKVAIVREAIVNSSRGLMYAGAIRAWQTEPVFGIGPGMHQNLWPHFAPSADGDRETGEWPSTPNYDFHSYEVHSDWLQLLEEYGAVGFTLFMIAFMSIACLLYAYYKIKAADRRPATEGSDTGFASVLAAILCFAAMTFHSLVDFNLQIPANTWLLAALIALPLGRLVRQR